MAQRTVAVAGNGAVAKNAVYDLLADWLGYEENEGDYGPTKRADDVHFVFFAHPDLISKTLQHVYNWTGRANIEYTAFYSERHAAQKAVELIVENSEESHASGDVEGMYADAVEYLRERGGDRTLVILSDTDGDDGKDAGCDELIIEVSKAGIDVLDLGCGLISYPVQKAIERALGDQEGEEPQGEAAPEVAESAPVPGDLQDDIAEAHREQGTQPPAVIEGKDDVADLVPLMLRLAKVIDGVMSSIASCVVVDFHSEQQALDTIRAALTPVQEEAPVQVVEGPYPVEAEDEDEPDAKAAGPKGGGPGDVRKGWFNEELNEYLPFRGRPRRDVEKHDIIQDPDSGKWIKYEDAA
ncbi:hypothetical protein ACIOEX_16130 [Streptomyces sp. NPDC087850]|uniref:hypothetical protein n=1 Tax=Streptomyces sp. NPDC087850 TaxID=3365809 RepID=UPI0037FB86D3